MDMLMAMRKEGFSHFERFMGVVLWPVFMTMFFVHLYNEFKNKRNGKGK
jgi:hypothetical protein